MSYFDDYEKLTPSQKEDFNSRRNMTDEELRREDLFRELNNMMDAWMKEDDDLSAMEQCIKNAAFEKPKEEKE